MKKNKQLRYFKSTSVFEVISALLILLGFLIYWYSFEIWVIGTPIMVLGVAGLILCYIFKVSDTAYGEYFENQLGTLPHTRREQEPDAVIDSYSTENTAWAKLDKNGMLRTERYVRTELFFGKAQLTVERSTVDAAAQTAVREAFVFDNGTASAEVEVQECRGGMSEKSPMKKQAVMVITGGESVCRFPVKYNDIETDQLLERINSLKPKA